MGFFSDLKEDLSQAVNELMPEEELDAVLSGETNAQKDILADELPVGADVTDNMAGSDEMTTAEEAFDLSSMLDKLDGMSMDDTAEEEMSATEETPIFNTAEEPMPEQTVTEPEPVVDTVEETIPEHDAFSIPQETEEETEDMTTVNYNGGQEKQMDVQTNRVAVDETAVVTEGMTITGDIISEGSLELIGTVNGNLDILGKLNITGSIQGNSKAAEIYAENAKITGEVNSQGSVKIGQSSVVIGNISATSAVIAGAVKGDIDVHGPVILDTTAIVMGNIKSKSVQINNGAVIEGLCSQCYADVNPTSFFEEFKKKK